MFQLNKILVLLAVFASLSFAGPVYVYGALKACTIGGKGQICGSKGSYANTAVQLRGVSLGWSNSGWESAAFFNARTVNAMVDGWRAEIIRVPLGIGCSGEHCGGYDIPAQKEANWNRVKEAVNAAIANDVYVIIDWHSHQKTDGAKDFFENVAAAYHNVPNVIFEVFNEPNGPSWSDIKSYAETVISALRAKNANNLVLVGTPAYSANLGDINGNYLSDNNVGYVFHFYAASHSSGEYSSRVTTVQNAGKPVFVTEYGTTDYTGGDPKESSGNYNSHSESASNAWHTYMDANKISSCAWQVDDKYAGASFFGTVPDKFNPFQQTAPNYRDKSMMTASGKYIFDKLNSYYNSAGSTHWSKQPQPSSSSGGGSGPTLIDDFEDGDSLAFTLEPWYLYTDAGDGGATTVGNGKYGDGEYIAVYKDGNDWVAGIKNYSLSKGTFKYDPYVAIGLRAQDNPLTYDLSKCTGGFRYKYKGSIHRFKMLQSNVEDYGYHFAVVPASTSWTTITIPVADLEQPNWGVGNPVPVARDIKKANGFAWEVNGEVTGTPTTGSLLIDDFTCMGALNLPLRGTEPSSPSEGGGSSSSEGSGDGDSSSSNTQTPITISKIANANSVQSIKNGISLQVINSATIEVFNLHGKLLRKQAFSSGVHSVNFQDLPKGLYVVRAKFGSRKEVLYVPIR